MRAFIVASFLLVVQAPQDSIIEVGEDRVLSFEGPALPLAESQLSVNPDNPNQLLIIMLA